MTAHATLPPSSAARWTVCTASVGYIDELLASGAIKPESSSYADEGSRAHALAAATLAGTALPPADNAEMQAHVDAYVGWVRGWHKKATKQTLWIERRVELFYSPGQKGTADAVVWGKNFVFIGDLKYGVGVSVDAKDNKQLAIYAESVLREIEEVLELPGDLPIILGIFQPRDRNNPEPVRTWELTRAELAKFCFDIQFAAVGILDAPKSDFIRFVADPDKQCRFCPAKGHCKTYASYGLSVVTSDVTAIEASLPNPNTITREQRQKILAARKPLEKWLEEIEAQELAELLAGAAPMGFKLVEGKTNRQWADEKAAEQLLSNYLSKEERRPPSDLVSPAAAEKLLKGKELSTRFSNGIAKLITKPSGKPTLVPLDDKRPALQINPTEGLTAVASVDDV